MAHVVDRLLVALETLELAEAGQAQRRHVLERKARRTQDERLELKVLRRATSPSCDVMWIGRAPTTSSAFSAAARLPSASHRLLPCPHGHTRVDLVRRRHEGDDGARVHAALHPPARDSKRNQD